MQLENTFTIPVPARDAWPILLDLNRVAPCLPGAALDSVEGDSFSGSVKVKLGAVHMSYRGEGKFIDKDDAAGRLVLDVRGSEVRGSGTASAIVTASLTEHDGITTVRVLTDIAITGRAAQFGRGILSQVSARIIRDFADNLAAQLGAEAQPAAADSVLDLGSVAFGAGAKRVAVAVAAVVLTAVGVGLWRRRRTR